MNKGNLWVMNLFIYKQNQLFTLWCEVFIPSSTLVFIKSVLGQPCEANENHGLDELNFLLRVSTYVTVCMKTNLITENIYINLELYWSNFCLS